MSLETIVNGYRELFGPTYSAKLELRRKGTPSEIDVLFFRSDDTLPPEESFVYIATAGLSANPLPGMCSHAELVMHLDGPQPNQLDQEELGRRLAGMAVSAYDDEMGLFPGMLLEDISVPVFDGMTHAIVTEFDYFKGAEFLVDVKLPTRVLHITPIFASEAEWVSEVGIDDALRVFDASDESLCNPKRAPVEFSVIDPVAGFAPIAIDRSIPELWKAIKVWLAAHSKEVLGQLRTGATADELRDMERQLGFAIPDDYAASLAIHNGGTVYGFALLSEYGYCDMKTALHFRELMLEAVQKGNSDGYEPKDSHGRIANVWWHPQWIPFADDNGDQICIDMAPGPNGVVGQIIYHDHGGGPRASRCRSFHEWLTMYCARLEGDYYEVDDEGAIRAR